MNRENLLETINQSLQKAKTEDVFFKEIYKDESMIGSNEFLMFVKPEITIDDPTLEFNQIMEMIFDKMEEYNLRVKNMQAISAGYLKKYDIIAQHYGVINQLARDAKGNLSDGAKTKFEEIAGKSMDDANMLGGLEFIEQYPHFNATSLDHLWQNSKVEKLAGGTYMARLVIDGQEVFLVNGFHPRQLEHFILPGRSIITMTITGDTSWKDARGKFIGSTDPSKAEKGSIRRELLEKKDEYGLTAVTPSWNGVHLSAGPVEGLVELLRYNSNFAENIILQPGDFAFGRMLQENFNVQEIHHILNNGKVNVNGDEISVFDLTEEKDSREALEVLKTGMI